MLDFNMIPSQLDEWLYDIEQDSKDKYIHIRPLARKYKRIKEVKQRIEERLKKKKVLFISFSYKRLIPPMGFASKNIKNV